MKLQWLSAVVICAFATPAGLLSSQRGQTAEGPPRPTESGTVVELFNGRDLSGWKVVQADRTQADSRKWDAVGEATISPANKRHLALKPGTGILANGTDGEASHLVSEYEVGDVYLHIEFMIPPRSNSGVYLQGLYEIQIVDSHGRPDLGFSSCGGIYARWREEEEETYEGHAPLVNASKPAGEWQSFDVVFRAPRFDRNGEKVENARFVLVVHNGQIVHQDAEVTGSTREAMDRLESPTGPLMLQGDHGPVAYRDIRMIPLALD